MKTQTPTIQAGERTHTFQNTGTGKCGICNRNYKEHAARSKAWVTLGNAIYLENTDICIGEIYPLASGRVRRLVEAAPALLDALRELCDAIWDGRLEEQGAETFTDPARQLIAKIEGQSQQLSGS